MGLDEITWGVGLNTEMSESDFSGKEALIKTDKQTNKKLDQGPDRVQE